MATKKNTAVKQNGKTYEYFKITKTIGHECKDGKKVPVKKQFYGSSKRDAERKYEEWRIAQENQNKGVRESVKTFGELCDFYTANVLAINAKYARGTIELYAGVYEKFKENDKTGLLSLTIGSVTAADIQLAYNSFNVSESTVRALNKFLRGFFNWAVLNQYCSDLLAAVTIPNKPKNKRKDEIVIWTDNELDTILTTLGDYRYRFLVIVAAYTGMRISEIFGLRYSDIDGDILHVRRQIYKGDVSDPKHKSFRDIPVHETVRAELAAHTARHKREMLKNGYRTEYIFTTNQGGLLEYANIRRSLNRLYARIGVSPKSPHTYRATFCTNLCRSGVPIQTAAALMGHKSVEVTAKFYTFVSQEEKISAINALPSKNLTTF